jgi:hypothetical protein
MSNNTENFDNDPYYEGDEEDFFGYESDHHQEFDDTDTQILDDAENEMADEYSANYRADLNEGFEHESETDDES